MYIPFGEWTPDAPAFGNSGLTEAINVIPTALGYRPFPTLAAVSVTPLPARPLGAASAVDNTGGAYTFAGTATALYRFVSLSFTDVSTVGGYATTEGETWEFAVYQDLLVAMNFTDDTQVLTLGAGSTFVDLSATAPKARTAAAVKHFLVFGNVNDGALNPQRVKWGPIGDPSGDYTPSPTTQADFQDLATGGAVKKIVGGEVGTIFCERAIWRMTYVGGQAIFQFDEIVPNRGCAAARSVANVGAAIFFLAEDGLFLLDGANLTPIGAEKIDRTLLADLDAGQFARMSAAIDPANKLYMLAYTGAGSAGGIPNRILLYNWAIGRFAIVEASTEMIAQMLTVSTTLEQLDAYGTLDSLPASLDSRLWAGGANLMSAFDSNYQLATFTGPNAAATLTTGEFEPIEFYRTLLYGVRPILEGDAPTVSFGTRNRVGDAVQWTGFVPTNALGKANTRLNARYYRVRMAMAQGASWKQAQGFQLEDEDYQSAGTR